MKKFTLLLVLLISLSCGAAGSAQAQDLVVNLLSGQTEQYPVSEIRSIKFTINSMALYQINGTVVSWEIADILNYQFDLASLSATDAAQGESNALKVYPNPSSDRVQIEYNDRKQVDIIIEVLDSSGKLVEVLYRGAHTAKTLAIWNIRSAAVASGTYLCRVSSINKVVTGKIIVH